VLLLVPYETLPDDVWVVIEQNNLVAGIRGQVPIIKVRVLRLYLSHVNPSLLVFREDYTATSMSEHLCGNSSLARPCEGGRRRPPRRCPLSRLTRTSQIRKLQAALLRPWKAHRRRTTKRTTQTSHLLIAHGQSREMSQFLAQSPPFLTTKDYHHIPALLACRRLWRLRFHLSTLSSLVVQDGC